MHVKSAFVLFLSLAACGGGGGTLVQSTTPTGPPELLAYIADQERIAQLILANNGANATAFAANTSTPVTFNGVMILDQRVNAPSPAYYGDMTATVDFSAQSLSGSATSFIYFDDSGSSTVGTPAAGTITMTSAAGTVVPDDPNTQVRDEFNITMGGSLVLAGTTTPAAATGTIGGAFAGPTPAGTSPYNTANDIQWFAGRGTTTIGGIDFETLAVGER